VDLNLRVEDVQTGIRANTMAEDILNAKLNGGNFRISKNHLLEKDENRKMKDRRKKKDRGKEKRIDHAQR
jgi:hypothetical protein